MAGLLAVLTMLVMAAPSDAATYATSVAPNPFSYSAAQQIVYRLHLTTGPTPERLRVTAGPGPSFPGSGGYFAAQGDMALEGPGTVVNQSRISAIADRFCTPVFPDLHGNGSFSTPMIEVDLPANSTSAIALPTRPYADAPWRGMDLAAEFRVGTEMIRTQSPVNSGRHGLPISLRTDPPGAFGACLSPFALPSVPFGRDVAIGGRTDPAVAGQLVTIRATRRGDASPTEVARVRIGRDGAFGHRWRPPAAGDYALGALYRSQSPALTDDYSEARSLRVLPPPQRVRLVAVTAFWRVRCSGRRCVIAARGSVKRPRAARGTRCTGTLRLRVAAGKRRLLSALATVGSNCRYRARRRFTLRSGRERFVAVRVSYLGDAVFRPRRGSVVRVTIRR